MNKNLTTVFSSKIQIASTVLIMLCIIATQGCSSASRATSTQSLPAEEVDEKVAPLKQDEVIDTQQIAQADDGFDGSAQAYSDRGLATYTSSGQDRSSNAEHLSIISDLTKAAELFHQQGEMDKYLGTKRLIDGFNEDRTSWVEEQNRIETERK
jgi:hypothetical protein